MRPAQVHAAIRREAVAKGRAFPEMLTLYGLERFLARLRQTPYTSDFVLKGGLLLAAYRLRRPTRDIDVQAVDLTLDQEHLRAVVAAVAAVESEDALVLDPDSVTVDAIRDDDEYGGLRVHVPSRIHTFRLDLRLDVSTGDPIWPAPQTVSLPGILGGTVDVLGYPLPMVVAEKTVTVLQRGTTSTRWRDFADVRSLARTSPFVAGDLATTAAAAASHRQITLGPIAAVTDGYGDIAQAKWTAWVSKNQMADAVEARFEDQLAAVIAFIDPVYSGEVSGATVWDPDAYSWR
jgi:hypothetical protein